MCVAAWDRYRLLTHRAEITIKVVEIQAGGIQAAVEIQAVVSQGRESKPHTETGILTDYNGAVGLRLM
jgi:hypothetical protein